MVKTGVSKKERKQVSSKTVSLAEINVYAYFLASQPLSCQVSEIWDDDFYPNLTSEQVELKIPLSNCMPGYKRVP